MCGINKVLVKEGEERSWAKAAAGDSEIPGEEQGK